MIPVSAPLSIPHRAASLFVVRATTGVLLFSTAPQVVISLWLHPGPSFPSIRPAKGDDDAGLAHVGGLADWLEAAESGLARIGKIANELGDEVQRKFDVVPVKLYVRRNRL